MWKRIVVPLDGSECAEAAFGLALDLAAGETAKLLVCAVVDPHQLADAFPQAGSAIGSWVAQVERDANEIVADAARRASTRDVACTTTVILEGPTAEAIVALAESSAADVIVMGTHGRSGFAHALMGSVAERVLRLATCAVITLRPKRAAHETSSVSDVSEGAAAAAADTG